MCGKYFPEAQFGCEFQSMPGYIQLDFHSRQPSSDCTAILSNVGWHFFFDTCRISTVEYSPAALYLKSFSPIKS